MTWIEVRLEPEGDGRTRFTLEHVAHVGEAVVFSGVGNGERPIG